MFAVAGSVGDMVLSWCSGELGLAERLYSPFLKVASVQKVCIMQCNEPYCFTSLSALFSFSFECRLEQE